MAEFLSMLAAQARALSALELVAVIAAIAYLLLAIRENIWCWLFAGVSTAIYVYLFYEARLYMESVLNGFYFVMAIYGWYVWRYGHAGTEKLAVCRWPLRRHAIAVVAVLILSATTGYLLQRYSDAVFPYIDSLTTWGAIWATFLVARKVLENWWYWLLIDIASVFIYWSRGLELTALLFVVYVVMIPFGLYRWSRSWREQLP
ncbi:MAG: nicotinamide riboside transporter PnuC [Woeseiaceae bacterium]